MAIWMDLAKILISDRKYLINYLTIGLVSYTFSISIFLFPVVKNMSGCSEINLPPFQFCGCVIVQGCTTVKRIELVFFIRHHFFISRYIIHIIHLGLIITRNA